VTLNPKAGDGATRPERFEPVIDRFDGSRDGIHQHRAKVMISFLAG
jgi:hypothetical protein